MNASLFDQQMELRRRRAHHGGQGFRAYGDASVAVPAQLSRPQLLETVAISVTVMVLSQLILRALTHD